MRLDPKPPIYSEKKRSTDAVTPSPKRAKTHKETRPLSDRDLDKRIAFMPLEPADKATLKTSLLCLQRVKNPSLPRLVKSLISTQLLPELNFSAEKKEIHAMILRSVDETVEDTVLGMAHFCHQFGLGLAEAQKAINVDSSDTIIIELSDAQIFRMVRSFFQAMNALPTKKLTYGEGKTPIFKDSINNSYTLFYDEIENGAYNNETIIDTTECEFHFLPRNINKLTNITKIYFCNENLQFLPEELFDIINLEEIICLQSYLTSIPPSIGKLINLKEISLSSNALTSLPASIGKLKKLEILNVWDNKLKKLPLEIKELDNLKILDLTCNESLERPFEALKYIREGFKVDLDEDDELGDFETLFKSIKEHKALHSSAASVVLKD